MSTEPTTPDDKIEKSPEQQLPTVKTIEEIAFEEQNPSVNYKVLKELEGSIVNSFKELVRKVILLNGTPFGEIKYKNSVGELENLKITNGRKKIYLKLIENFAVLEFIGNKCRIVAVLDEKSVNKALNKAKKARLQKRFNNI